jgi:hypothetical protein
LYEDEDGDGDEDEDEDEDEEDVGYLRWTAFSLGWNFFGTKKLIANFHGSEGTGSATSRAIVHILAPSNESGTRKKTLAIIEKNEDDSKIDENILF